MERGSAEFGVQLGEVGLRTQVHDFLTGTFSCLAFSPGDETKLVEATAKVSVTFIAGTPGCTTLCIKEDMTFDVYFRSSYPETPPIVHVVRGGGVTMSLLVYTMIPESIATHGEHFTCYGSVIQQTAGSLLTIFPVSLQRCDGRCHKQRGAACKRYQMLLLWGFVSR